MLSKIEKTTCVRICAAKDLERDGVVIFPDTVRDIVRADTGASRCRCRASKVRGLGGGGACDLVRAETGSWSPL